MSCGELVECPKRMVYGPCSGVHEDSSCELDARPCPFTRQDVIEWTELTTAAPNENSVLLQQIQTRPVVLTDVSAPPYDRSALTGSATCWFRRPRPCSSASTTNRPDFPPTMIAEALLAAGATPWMTLACRDRNRVVLEQELRGLQQLGVDTVLCVTGDGRGPDVRPDVTQVFDLDGPRLAELATAVGLCAAVPETPLAPPRRQRAGRLLQKERAGAHLAVLNHVGSVAQVRDFVGQARALGVTLPILAAVTIFTDERSARALQNFPGLQLDAELVEEVLSAPDPVQAGIQAAVGEAEQLLAVAGVDGVNLSGLASGRNDLYGAEIKSEIGRRVTERREH